MNISGSEFWYLGVNFPNIRKSKHQLHISSRQKVLDQYSCVQIIKENQSYLRQITSLHNRCHPVRCECLCNVFWNSKTKFSSQLMETSMFWCYWVSFWLVRYIGIRIIPGQRCGMWCKEILLLGPHHLSSPIAEKSGRGGSTNLSIVFRKFNQYLV